MEELLYPDRRRRKVNLVEEDIIADVAPRLFARLDELLAAQPDPLIIFEMPGELSVTPAGWTCIKRLGKGSRQPTAAIFRANRALP